MKWWWMIVLLAACAAPAALDPQCAVCEQGEAGENIWCPQHEVGVAYGKVHDCKACFQGDLGGPGCRQHDDS